MPSERTSQNIHLPSSSVAEFCNQIIPQYFKPSGKKLNFVVDLLESYQTVLDSDANFAQLFGVPLASDSKAAVLNLLFSKEKPQVVQVRQSSNHDINWTDVLCSTPYHATLQENGNYHVQIEKGDALIEVSKEDHDFILTEMPRQLINPHSYPGDIALENSALNSVIDQMTVWQDLAFRLNKLIKSNLSKLHQRVGILEEKSDDFRSQASFPSESSNVDRRCSTTAAHNEGPAIAPKPPKPNLKGGCEQWSDDESDSLPGFFKSSSHLSKKEIAQKYSLLTGKHRTYGSLQSRLYKIGRGDLTLKKKGGVAESVEPKTTPSIAISPSRPGLFTPISSNSASFSQARDFIVGSAHNTSLFSLDPQIQDRAVEAQETSILPMPLSDSRLYPIDDGLHSNDFSVMLPPEGFHPDSWSISDGKRNEARDQIENESSKEASPSRAERSAYDDFDLGKSRTQTPSAGKETPAHDIYRSSYYIPRSFVPPSTSNDRRDGQGTQWPRVEEDSVSIDDWQAYTTSENTQAPNREDCVTSSQKSQPESPRAASEAPGSNLERSSSSMEVFRKGVEAVNQTGQAHREESLAFPILEAEDRQGNNVQSSVNAGFGDNHHLLNSNTVVASAPQPPKKRKREYKRRSKSGCITCRRRRKKCDEKKPSCDNCLRSCYQCEGYSHFNAKSPIGHPAIEQHVPWDISNLGTKGLIEQSPYPPLVDTGAEQARELPPHDQNPANIGSGHSSQNIPSIHNILHGMPSMPPRNSLPTESKETRDCMSRFA